MNTLLKNLFRSFLIYCAIFLFGLFVICFVQYQYHANLRDFTAKTANELNEDENSLKNIRRFHGCLFLVNENDTEPVLLYADDDSIIYKEFLTSFIKKHDSSPDVYQLDIRMNPLTFFCVASSPLYIQNDYAGYLYAVHTISYLPSVIHTFLLIYTVIYCILSMHLYFVQKINNRITSIYRKYIANISHELKSPIASIHAITETLNAGLVNDEETLHRYYGIIDRESHRLERSVLDIIELSKIQDQRIDVSKKITNISDIVTPIQKRYEEFCEDVGIRFIIDPSFSNLPDLYTNADRIIQLLQLLIDNAVKFTSEGGMISLYAKYDEKQAILCVKDNGCGMDDETISHIFERFYRGNNTSEYEGSGLGLSIAKEIVNALDEKIWAKSELGIGTSFYLTVSRKKKFWKFK